MNNLDALRKLRDTDRNAYDAIVTPSQRMALGFDDLDRQHHDNNNKPAA